MKKCYIAGKIGDLPEAEYKENFERAKREVRALGYEPVSPVDIPHKHERTWESYMKEDIAELVKCDAIYVLRNWKDSPGAIVEVTLAAKLKIKSIHQPMRVLSRYELLKDLPGCPAGRIFKEHVDGDYYLSITSSEILSDELMIYKFKSKFVVDNVEWFKRII